MHVVERFGSPNSIQRNKKRRKKEQEALHKKTMKGKEQEMEKWSWRIAEGRKTQRRKWRRKIFSGAWHGRGIIHPLSAGHSDKSHVWLST